MRERETSHGNVLISKVNPALLLYLPLFCFIPHRLFTNKTVLEQLVRSSRHIPPILMTFLWMKFNWDSEEAKIIFPQPIIV
jgi:hypothetical protein